MGREEGRGFRIETIEDALVAGDSVRLIGFGTFETRSRKARTGRNPQKPRSEEHNV